MSYRIVLIPGDGIGPEVTSAAQRVVEAAGIGVDWQTHLAGQSALDKLGSPLPADPALIDGCLVDFVWRNRRLIVEVDGYRCHRSPQKFESDREQDVELGAKGWTTLRFTWRRLSHHEAWVANAVRTSARSTAE